MLIGCPLKQGGEDLFILDELTISTMWENAALIELLHEKGLITKQELLDKITDLRWKHPWANMLADSARSSARPPT